MNIDTIAKKVDASKHYLIQSGKYHSFYEGIRYCFCYSDGIAATVGNPYAISKENYDWVNERLSVLFSSKELNDFKPNDSIHSYLLKLNEERINEAKRYAQLYKDSLKTAKKRGAKFEFYGDTNLTELYESRHDYLSNNTIIFLEINFDN